MSNFAATVQALSEKYQRQTRAVMRGSVQEVVSKAQRVGESKKGIGGGKNEGGRMRVDTGFLRASLAASTGSMPTGESVNPDPTADGVVFQYEGTDISMALLNWQAGETMYVGWTANYARPREYRDGFLRGAVEEWDGIVKNTVHNVRRRM